ncbi:hypothetical protein HDV01_006970 [Terramyces sp. JEL0728]|nr:hypothetical protein HDV01_006970 [Terramyces sp. JEL0728]
MIKQILPIDEKLPELIELINNNKVVICVAATGTGKTTRIAPAIHKYNPKSKVYLTQPRRNACQWNAERIALEIGCEIGTTVGWRMKHSKMISNDTKIELLIDQSLLNRIQKDKKLPEGVIIIDEVHERSIIIDLLLAVIKKFIYSSKNTKLVLTSATVNAEKLSAFFNDAPIFEVTGHCFYVEVKSLHLSHEEHHTEGACRAAKDVMDQFLKGTLTIPSEDCNGREIVTKGVVIILLPGKRDISDMEESIKKAIPKDCNKVQVFKCSGESSKEEMNQAQTVPKDSTLHFVCGTEVLRSSITIPHTIGVIDSLQVKRIHTNEYGYSHLEKIAVSKSDALQGKGRAGRTSPGFYIPVGSEYHTLEEWHKPAIIREPILRMVLTVALSGYDILDFEFIDSPCHTQIRNAQNNLKVFGALDKNKNITKLGEELIKYSLDPPEALILKNASKYDVLPEVMILIGIFKVNGIFKKPPSSDIRNYWLEKGCSNDFGLIIAIYREFKLEANELTLAKKGKASSKEMNDFCSKNDLILAKIRKAEDVMKEIKLEFKVKQELVVKKRGFNVQNVTKALVTGWFDKISCRVENYQESSRDYKTPAFKFKLANESLCSPKEEFILHQHLVKIHKKSYRGRENSFNLVHYASPVDKRILREVLSKLIVTSLEPPYYDISKDCIQQKQTFSFKFGNNTSISLESKLVSPGLDDRIQCFLDWVVDHCHSSDSIEKAYPELAQIIKKNGDVYSSGSKLPYQKREEIFRQWSRKNLLEHYSTTLNGMTCIADVKNFDAFALPNLTVINQTIQDELMQEQIRQLRELERMRQLRELERIRQLIEQERIMKLREERKNSRCNVM